ncbi:NADP-dependent isocitrate dehydrogenase [Desulfurella sp.]|uniref:NADP-dependent isocitrate dehydrogenase n=1 Tax=Desulfurella sp. TaxID=1962857 RepID=UPI003D125B1F
MSDKFKIYWTKVDEAPYLATFSLLPAVEKFLKAAGISVEIKDISVAGRILANFPVYLKADQQVPDDLSELAELVKLPDTNVIKLPNISASIPQLVDAIKELQNKGYNVPDYPEEPKTEEEKKIKETYSKVLGSAVNPVLREGNNIRAISKAVKESAKKYPDSMGLPLKPWSKDSKTHVTHMRNSDFYEHEKSITTDKPMKVKIEFVDETGKSQTLKEVALQEKEVFDGTFMDVEALQKFFGEEIAKAKQEGILWSLHLKATMMKVSDPVMFGFAVKEYYKDVFAKHEQTFKEIGVNPNNGVADIYLKIKKLPENKQKEIEADIQSVYEKNPPLFMVDSDKGITNLHMPNLVIIDASLPTIVRDGGKAWGPDGKQNDVKVVIPDRCYATMYKEIIEDCKINGQFDRTTMGSVTNIGLMAMKAEEYGSHDKTFMAPANGTFKVVDENKNVLFEHNVKKGDIWRGCQVKDAAVKNWVQIAVERAKQTKNSTAFWLDENRAHDAQLIKKVSKYLKDYDTNGLDIRILKPQEAMKFTVAKVRNGEDVIAVTGNALRDYLTDLFPILEVGTSAKVLSIIPLLAGGRVSEAGAGGSAPKHVEQFIEQGHLRWDSTAEFTAITTALRFLEEKYDDKKAKVLADASEVALTKLLANKQWPGRKPGELDNRGQHYYFIKYWTESLAAQNDDKDLQAMFAKPAKELNDKEKTIIDELKAASGKPANINGYYFPDEDKLSLAMRSSKTFNFIIDSI